MVRGIAAVRVRPVQARPAASGTIEAVVCLAALLGLALCMRHKDVIPEGMR